MPTILDGNSTDYSRILDGNSTDYSRVVQDGSSGEALAALQFDEPADRPAGTLLWPITIGVPFANGSRDTVADLSICDGQMAHPTQFAAALDWRFGDGGISWAHCDFLAPLGGGAVPRRALRTDVANPAPATAVSVTEDSGSITVDTGEVTFTISKTALNLFESFDAGATNLVSSSQAYWKDTDGNVYDASSVVDSVTVEKDGPIKAVLRVDGKYKVSGGRQMLRYQVWIAAWANSPFVRVYHRLLWDQNLTLRVTTPTGGTVCTTVVGLITEAGTAVAHGWQTGDEVRFAYTHPVPSTGVDDLDEYNDASGTNLPAVSGTALNRTTTYYARAASGTTLTLHRTLADAQNNASPINFVGAPPAGYASYLMQQKPVLAEYGLKLNLAQTATTSTVWTGDSSAGAANAFDPSLGVVAQQTSYDPDQQLASIVPGVGAPVTAVRLSGLMKAAGATRSLCVALKDPISYPKQFDIYPTYTKVRLWGGSTPMPMREEARVDPRWLNASGHATYRKENLIDQGEANPFGVARTHEIWLWPSQGSSVDVLANDLVQRPPCCVASPGYACGTDYAYGLSARSSTPAAYSAVETALENMLRYLARRDADFLDYDEWHFGQMRLFQNGSFREWNNNGHNEAELFWLQLYRSGVRFFLEEGIRVSRAYMDVGLVNVSQTASVSFAKIAGRSNVYHTVPWGVTNAYGDAFDDHPQHLLMYWLLTGYEPAAVCLQMKADERAAAGYGDPGTLGSYAHNAVTRSQYGSLAPKLAYYEYTGNAGYLSAMTNWATLFTLVQADGLTQDAADNHLFSNNPFHGLFFDGLRYLWRVTGNDDWADALRQQVENFSTNPASNYASQDWTVTDDASLTDKAGFPANVANLSVVANEVAYRLTGDADYLRQPVEQLAREARTVQSSGPYIGYHATQGLQAVIDIRGGLYILGSLKDAGWPTLTWAGSFPFFASRPVSKSPWLSQMTLFVSKSAGSEGHLKLYFKSSNLNGPELPFTNVRAVSLAPDDTVTTTTLASGSAIYSATLNFASGDAGIFRVFIQGQQQLLWVSPKTDMDGLVVELNENRDMTVERTFGAADVFFRMDDGISQLTLSTPAATLGNAHLALPVAVLDGDYNELGRLDWDGRTTGDPGGGDVSLALSAGGGAAITPIEEILVLARGREQFSPSGLSGLPTVRLTGAKRHASPVAAQLFDPFGTINGYASAFWKMDEPSGADAVDATGNGRDLAHRLTAPSTTAIGTNAGGTVGSARQFIAMENHYFQSTDAVFRADASFSVWGWIRHDSDSAARYLWVKGGNFLAPEAASALEWGVYILDGTVNFAVRIGVATTIFIGPQFAQDTGSLHFVAARYDSSAARLYLQVDNGTPGESPELSGAINAGNLTFKVGGVGASGRGLQGLMDAAGFAKRFLTDHELTLLYNDGQGLEYPF
ncbi:MAG: hypothetical protein HYX69_04770 [Planctomycetia bacterium]|nr:hypothetical protein [Planctomycetia bacterium]